MLRFSALAAAAMVSGTGLASAASLTWDPGLTPATPSGGTGSWATGLSNWSNGTSDGTFASAIDSATFGGTPGIVTLATNLLNPTTVTFAAAGYTLNSTSNAILSVGTGGLNLTQGTAETINLFGMNADNSTWTNTDQITFSGSAGFNGSRTLTLTNASGLATTFNNFYVSSQAASTGRNGTLTGTAPVVFTTLSGSIGSLITPSSTSSLVYNGTGGLTINGNNTFFGVTSSTTAGFTLAFVAGNGSTSGVSVTLGNDNALGGSVTSTNNPSTLVVMNQATLQTSATRNLANNLILLGNSTFGGAQGITINGSFTNSGATGYQSLSTSSTSVAAHSLAVTDAAGATLAGNVYLSEAQTTTTTGVGRILTLQGTTPLLISGVISDFNPVNTAGVANTATTGNNTVNISGSNVVTFSATNTFLGALNINSGILATTNLAASGSASGLGSGSSVTIAAAGTLRYTGPTFSTFNRTINGTSGYTIDVTNSNTNLTVTGTSVSGGVVKAGAGMLTITGPSSLTGATVSAGTLVVGGNVATLGGTIAANGSLSLGGGTGVSNALNVSGSLTGAVPVTIDAGAGFVNLSGSNTGFTSNVLVNTGELRVGATTALAAANTVTVASGADMDVRTNATIGGLNDVSGSAGTVTNTQASPTTLTFSGGATSSFAGVITATTPANLSIVTASTFTGVQTLNGSNTFTTGVTINNGTLATSNLAAGGTPSGIGASAATTPLTINNAGAFRYIGPTFANFDRATASNGTYSIDVSQPTTTLTATGTLSSGLFKTGAGTLQLATNTAGLNFATVNAGILDDSKPSGAGTIIVLNINGGTFLSGSGNLSNTDLVAWFGSVAFNGGVYDLNGHSLEQFNSLSGTNGVVTNGAASTVSQLQIGGWVGTTTFAGAIRDGSGTVSLLKQQADAAHPSQEILAGTNTYSGGTSITGGTLTLDNGGVLGHSNMTISGGTLNAGTTGAGGTVTDNIVGDTFELISLSGSGVLDLTHLKLAVVATGTQTQTEYVLANKAVGSDFVTGTQFASLSLPSNWDISYTGTVTNPNEIVLIDQNLPAPEPGSLGLLSLGAVGLMRRRRTNR